MSRSALLAGALLALTVAVTAQQGRSGGPPPEPPASTVVKACEELSSLTFPKLRVTSATSVSAGAARTAWSTTAAVAGVVPRGRDRDANFRL